MQEQQNQIKIYSFFQKMVYFIVLLDCASLFFLSANIPFVTEILRKFSKMGLFYPPLHAKICTMLLITLVAIGTKAKKKIDLNIGKQIILPIIVGLTLMFSSLLFTSEAGNNSLPKIIPPLNFYQIIYTLLSFLGALIAQVGADNISENGKRPLEY
jgi:hypothetical protein